MKGYLTSYTQLFHHDAPGIGQIREIEIPLIQRDYAQGRPDARATEIRTAFLQSLLNAVAGGPPLSLDFVYGTIDEGVLRPLDGQQRLTTLHLLHWYIASAADTLDPDAPWLAFSYATRPAARHFCRLLASNPLPAERGSPSDWITDQSWFLHSWANDPTIQAMLVVLDAIGDTWRARHPDLSAETAWTRLSATDAPAVSFYLLPIADMGSEEDLYVKMNSRGRPLTPFENFKARFEKDIAHSDRSSEFAEKIDGSWADLLWSADGKDNLVDDRFFRYFDYLTEVCEWKEGRLATGPLGPRAKRVFGPENPRSAEHLDFLFEAFDRWDDLAHVEQVFDETFQLATPGAADYDPSKVTLFGPKSTNLLLDCCEIFDSTTSGNRSFTLQQSLLLYAVLLHQVQGTPDFQRRIRALRNAIAASENEVRRENMPQLLEEVTTIIEDGTLEHVKRFNTNQLEDERRKQDLLDAHPESKDFVCRLEDSPLLRGTLSAFGLEPATIGPRATAFEAALHHPSTWPHVTRALLTTGDYQRQRSSTGAWLFGTGSSKHESVWRDLLTAASRKELTPTRSVLSTFLDALAGSDSESVVQQMDAMVTTWLENRESTAQFDWRYYLVKYPAKPEEGATGLFYGVEGKLGYSLCMLRTKQRNGLYRDPILLAVWRASGIGDLVDDPWFTGYEDAPRWLRLVRSQTGVRCVEEGFELEPPTSQDLKPAFTAVCESHSDVQLDGDRILLRIPQTEVDGNAVDTVDRVQTGAGLLNELAEAGL